MITITIPDWVLLSVGIYFFVNEGLQIWKNILDESIKKWTKKLVNNQQLIKDLRDTIEAQNKGGAQVGRKDSTS